MRRIVPMTFAILFLYSACGPGVEDVIVGEWVVEGSEATWRFSADGSFTMREAGRELEGSYRVEGNELLMRPGGMLAGAGPRLFQVTRVSKEQMSWCRSRGQRARCFTVLKKD